MTKREQFHIEEPAPFRLYVLGASLTFGTILLINGDYLLSVVAFLPAVAIIYATICNPLSAIALQADGRSRAKACSYNLFIDALYFGGVIDEHTEDGDFHLECLDAPEPDVFVLWTKQAGKSLSDIEDACKASLLAFDASEVLIEQVPNAIRKNGTYKITFSKANPIEDLTRRYISITSLGGSYPDVGKIPVGEFCDGSPVEVSLKEANMLVNGNPRSGKSVFLSVLICQLCKCQNERIVIMSPKLLDFANFTSAHACTLVSDPQKMLNVLQSLQDENARRKELCLASGQKKISSFSSDTPHITVIIDEYTVVRKAIIQEKKPRKIGEEIELELMKLVAETGFAGISFVIATQRVSSTNISTDLRDLISGTRVSFATETEEANRMIFGPMAKSAPCHLIPTTAKGVGYISTSGATPRLFKSAIATDLDEKSYACENGGSGWKSSLE